MGANNTVNENFWVTQVKLPKVYRSRAVFLQDLCTFKTQSDTIAYLIDVFYESKDLQDILVLKAKERNRQLRKEQTVEGGDEET